MHGAFGLLCICGTAVFGPGANAIVAGDGGAVAVEGIFFVALLAWVGMVDEIGHAAAVAAVADNADVVVVEDDDVAALPLVDGAGVGGQRSGVAREIDGKVGHAAVVDVAVRWHTEVLIGHFTLVGVDEARQVVASGAQAIGDDVGADAGAIGGPAAVKISALILRPRGDVIEGALKNVLLIRDAVAVGIGGASDGGHLAVVAVGQTAVRRGAIGGPGPSRHSAKNTEHEQECKKTSAMFSSHCRSLLFLHHTMQPKPQQ